MAIGPTGSVCQKWSRTISLWCLTPILIILACCGDESGQAEVQVGAAASLRWVMPELARSYEERTGVRVAITFAASGTIAQQISGGAPIDLFCSADSRWVEKLLEEELVQPESVATYALGELVLGFSEKSHRRNAMVVLQDGDFERIGIANPELAPYGRAAGEVLKKLEIREALEERIVYAENVGQVLTYLLRGNIDCGFLPRSLAESGGCPYLKIPREIYSPLEQVLVVPLAGLNHSGGNRFAHFILGDEGRAILVKHGFSIPEEGTADDT